MERLHHIRTRIRLQQRVALLHQLLATRRPITAIDLVFHNQRHAARHHLEHVREQRHMLVIPQRRLGRGHHQAGGLHRVRHRLGQLAAGARRRGIQRDPGQLVIGQVADAARIARHTHQRLIVGHHHLAVHRQLDVELDAVPGLTGGGERGQGVLRGDRADAFGRTVAGLHRHPARQGHVLPAFSRILRGQAGTGVVQAAMRVPDVRDRRHVVVALVGETARGDRPRRGTRRSRAGQQHLTEHPTFRHDAPSSGRMVHCYRD